MKSVKLSVNNGCILLGAAAFLLCAGMTLGIFFLTRSLPALLLVLSGSAGMFLCMALLLIFLRRKLILFSDGLCALLDEMMSSDREPSRFAEEEGLFYKISHRITRLYDVLRESREAIAGERADLQELVSDISHQVKTPVANLKMINATLLEEEVPPAKQKEFLLAMEGQLDKLDFLMQAMIKTSRLETGVISLKPEPQAVYDTLALALGGILIDAEKKQIRVTVTCPENISALHDRKWTGEALFNLLDNAVKYTPDGGRIHVSAEAWEMYVKIDITDTGRGIPEAYQGAVFKRFYREDAVHDVPGIGIGLYLAREIISRQHGVIRLRSSPGAGSTFSVFLPRP